MTKRQARAELRAKVKGMVERGEPLPSQLVRIARSQMSLKGVLPQFMIERGEFLHVMQAVATVGDIIAPVDMTRWAPCAVVDVWSGGVVLEVQKTTVHSEYALGVLTAHHAAERPVWKPLEQRTMRELAAELCSLAIDGQLWPETAEPLLKEMERRDANVLTIRTREGDRFMFCPATEMVKIEREDALAKETPA